MVRAKAIASDNPRDTHQVYVVVDRDGARILRVNTDEAAALAQDRKVDERVRRVLHNISHGVHEA